jgi:hypothetical protein
MMIEDNNTYTYTYRDRDIYNRDLHSLLAQFIDCYQYPNYKELIYYINLVEKNIIPPMNKSTILLLERAKNRIDTFFIPYYITSVYKQKLVKHFLLNCKEELMTKVTCILNRNKNLSLDD